jgi:hypothetical protein
VNSLDKVFNIAAAIVGLAIVAVVIKSKNTATDVKAVGNLFEGSINAARQG